MIRPQSRNPLHCAIAVAMALAASGCFIQTTDRGDDESAARAGGVQRQRPAPTQAARPNASIQFETASRDTRSRVIQVAGRLEPRTRIVHRIPVAGVVREVRVSNGQRVRPGDVLISIEREEIGQTFLPVPVTARIGGIVSDLSAQPEEQVSAGDPALAIVGLDGFLLEARVSDKDARSLRVGEPITARSSSGQTATGRLLSRSQEPDYTTGLFTVAFEFAANQPVGIGTFLVLDLPAERVPGVFVNRNAIDRRYGRYFLWIVDEQEQSLTRREVTLGATIGDEIAVASGLSPGERYVPRPTGREREGTSIAVQTAPTRTGG